MHLRRLFYHPSFLLSFHHYWNFHCLKQKTAEKNKHDCFFREALLHLLTGEWCKLVPNTTRSTQLFWVIVRVRVVGLSAQCFHLLIETSECNAMQKPKNRFDEIYFELDKTQLVYRFFSSHLQRINKEFENLVNFFWTLILFSYFSPNPLFQVFI